VDDRLRAVQDQHVPAVEAARPAQSLRDLYEDPKVLEKVPVAALGKEAIIVNATPPPSRLTTRTCV